MAQRTVPVRAVLVPLEEGVSAKLAEKGEMECTEKKSEGRRWCPSEES